MAYAGDMLGDVLRSRLGVSDNTMTAKEKIETADLMRQYNQSLNAGKEKSTGQAGKKAGYVDEAVLSTAKEQGYSISNEKKRVYRNKKTGEIVVE